MSNMTFVTLCALQIKYII